MEIYLLQVLTGIFGVGAKTADRWIRDGIHTLQQLRESGHTLTRTQQAGVCSDVSACVLVFIQCLCWCVNVYVVFLRTGALRRPQHASVQSRGGRYQQDRGGGGGFSLARITGCSHRRIQEVREKTPDHGWVFTHTWNGFKMSIEKNKHFSYLLYLRLVAVALSLQLLTIQLTVVSVNLLVVDLLLTYSL